MQTEGGEGAGVDDVEGGFLLGIGTREGACESAGFEQRNAIEPPGSVNEFLDELGFSGCRRLVFVERSAGGGPRRQRGLRWEDGEAAVRPWLRALCEERCFPAAVRGPVDRWAFPRLMEARRLHQRRTGSVVMVAAIDSGAEDMISYLGHRITP
jgi:hypothetical protein